MKRRNILILIGVTVVILGVALFLIYKLVSSENDNKKIETAKTEIAEGKPGEALAITDELLSSNRDEEVYEMRVSIFELLSDYDSLRDTYNELYSLTGDVYYQEKINYLTYGNIFSNSLQESRVVRAGSRIFYITFESDGAEIPIFTYNLYIWDGESTESIFMDQGSQALITDLEVWGNLLYFRTSRGIKTYNLYSREVKDLVIPGTESSGATEHRLENLTIYNGNLYFINTLFETNYYTENTVCRAGLDGTGLSVVVPTQPTTGVGITRINRFYPVGTGILFRTTNNTIGAVKLYDNGKTDTLMESETLGDSFAVLNNTVYSSDGGSIKSFSLIDGATNEFTADVNGSFGLNAAQETVYYFSSEGLNRFSLQNNVITKLTDFSDKAYGANVYILGESIYSYETVSPLLSIVTRTDGEGSQVIAEGSRILN